MMAQIGAETCSYAVINVVYSCVNLEIVGIASNAVTNIKLTELRVICG